MAHHLSLHLSSQFLDSFIYSGALLLASPDGKITVYDWKSLVLKVLSAHGRADLAIYFIDYRLQPKGGLDCSLQFAVDDRVLESVRLDCMDWGVWLTDFTVLSNTLYISDENGVHAIPLDYQRKTLDQNARARLKDGYVYGLAGGDGRRVAAATSMDGLAVLHRAYGRVETKVIVHEEVFDCDWFGSRLVANAAERAYVADLPSLPQRRDYRDIEQYREDLYKVLMSPPDRVQVRDEAYAWLVGSDLFQEFLDDGDAHFLGKNLIKARSASFGSVLEYKDRVELIRSTGREDLGVHRPVFWRVFSRSKNYLNHLHICDSGGLQIRSYESAPEGRDRYSIELNDL